MRKLKIIGLSTGFAAIVLFVGLVIYDHATRRFDEGYHEVRVVSHGITKAKTGNLGITLVCETLDEHRRRVYVTRWIGDDKEGALVDIKQLGFNGKLADLAKPGPLVGKQFTARMRYSGTLFKGYENWSLPSERPFIRNAASQDDLASLR